MKEKIYVISEYARKYYQSHTDEQLQQLRTHLEHQIKLIDSNGATQVINRKTGKPQKAIPMPWMRNYWSKTLEIIIEEQESRSITKA